MKGSELHTELSRKLGLQAEDSILVYNVPQNYGKMIGDLTDHLYWLESNAKEVADFIHIFSSEENDLEKALLKYIPALKRTGMLWVSWSKKSSSLHKGMGRDDVRELVLDKSSLVEVKVASIDSNWSGLKFVYRKTD